MPNPATITIADEPIIRKSDSQSETTRFRPLKTTETTGLAGGIYKTNARAISAGSLHRNGSRVSYDRRSRTEDVEEGDDWRDADGPKTKQVFKGKTLFW